MLERPEAYRVACSRCEAGYEDPAALAAGVRALGHALGWAKSGAGVLGNLVQPGARVVVKPNWVMHRNQGPWGLDCLVTHPSLVRAVVDAVLEGPVAEVVVGDAPIQGCDFATLVAWGHLDRWAADLAAREPRFIGVRDFRRTRSRMVRGVPVQEQDRVPEREFVLFDLGSDSLLEPVTGEEASFRVTQYDPALMAKTHRFGRHQYFVARALIEADLVVNLPKLKTHRKAGMTNALKNLVGINGNKEYLPHHRVGGAGWGGDCYPGRSLIKRAYEIALDLQNGTRSHALRRVLNLPARVLSITSRLVVDSLGVEGAWSGNDTVWRMCLDLNRILLYGRIDGTLAEQPQRRVVSVVDAVVAGQGDGPLAPEPLSLGLLMAGESAAAVDLVATAVLGYQADRIPIVREAFREFRWPLAPLGRAAVVPAWADGTALALGGLPRPLFYPAGWLDAVATEGRTVAPAGRSFHLTLRPRLVPEA